MPDLSEYEARALRGALDRASDSALRWLPDYMDRLDRQLEELRLLIERNEAAPAPDTAAHLAWLRDGGRLARALGSTGCGHSSCPRDTSRHDEEAAAILDALTNPTTQEVTPHG